MVVVIEGGIVHNSGINIHEIFEENVVPSVVVKEKKSVESPIIGVRPIVALNR